MGRLLGRDAPPGSAANRLAAVREAAAREWVRRTAEGRRHADRGRRRRTRVVVSSSHAPTAWRRRVRETCSPASSRRCWLKGLDPLTRGVLRRG